mgnify:CR=1 FL=1
MTESDNVYYSDYLALDRILDAQAPRSFETDRPAHDEMLFIIVHQTYELWFKQVLHELDSVNDIFGQDTIDDTGPEMQVAAHRLRRIVEILRIAVEQISVMETMTPMDFMEFRDLLRPASGFQSVQFKILEAALGLEMDERHGKAYYRSQLRPADLERLEDMEGRPSFVEHLNGWLERAPFWGEDRFWTDYQRHTTDGSPERHVFWQDYAAIYREGLTTGETNNMDGFNEVLFGASDQGRRLSSTACRAALFIMLYRDYPLFHAPYQLLESLLDIDEMLARWRFRHYNMVRRMIGSRVGTGGSTGQDYLFGALREHYIFKEIAALTTFLMPRRARPALGETLARSLSFRD